MYITYLLLAATILISVKAFNDHELRAKLMFNAYDVAHNKQWYRCFTHAFIHADYLHLGFNMFVLYMFAVQVTPEMGNFYHYSLEPALVVKYGAKGYLYFGCLYLGGILFSTLFSLAKYKDNPGYNSLGASGAVMAVVFAYIMMNPTARLGLMFLPGLDIPAYIFGPIMLAIEYYMGKRGGTGIAHEAHFAGAVFGIIFMVIIDYNYLINFFNQIVG